MRCQFLNHRKEKGMPRKSSPLVLVTGGAGFIGSHTADALIREGYRVRILDCLDPQIHGLDGTFPSYLNTEIECIQGNVCSSDDVQKAMEGVSFVYHFASLTGVGQSMYDIKNYTDVNISGTATLLETIVKNKFPVKRLILSSSRAVYGEGTHECPSCGVVYPPTRSRVDLENNDFEVFCPNCRQKTVSVATQENRPLIPISVYGWTKKSQEDLFEYASKTFGLSVVILRYFNVYGSRQSLKNPYTGIVSIFYSRLLADQAIAIYEHGAPLRDFIHVSDVVQANLHALEKAVPSLSVLNVGTGASASIFDVANALARAVGREPRYEDQGDFRVGDIHACVADLARTGRILKYNPKVSLEEGMQEFVDWALKQQPVDLYERMVDELKGYGLFGRSEPKRQM
jgi:dTDP-L-rhamnose 4-epimerase